MDIEFYCPRWGSEHTDWEVFLQNVTAESYSGIEWFPFGDDSDPNMVIKLLKKYNLKYTIVMTVLGTYSSFEEYLELLNKQLLELTVIGKGLQSPLFISAQVGREYFTNDQVDRCISSCQTVSELSKIPIYHETHRNKWTYASHVCHDALKRNPSLLLTLDMSHWFCVSESYLEDQKPAIALAISCSRHIHARVGHTQGSQVSDPRLPCYSEALEAHLRIWDLWIESRKFSGDKICTITPEFGPPPYLLNTSEYTDHQLQWDLNVWMKNFLKRRYSKI
jgi:hypothetical protein